MGNSWVLLLKVLIQTRSLLQYTLSWGDSQPHIMSDRRQSMDDHFKNQWHIYTFQPILVFLLHNDREQKNSSKVAIQSLFCRIQPTILALCNIRCSLTAVCQSSIMHKYMYDALYIYIKPWAYTEQCQQTAVKRWTRWTRYSMNSFPKHQKRSKIGCKKIKRSNNHHRAIEGNTWNTECMWLEVLLLSRYWKKTILLRRELNCRLTMLQGQNARIMSHVWLTIPRKAFVPKIGVIYSKKCSLKEFIQTSCIIQSNLFESTPTWKLRSWFRVYYMDLPDI